MRPPRTLWPWSAELAVVINTSRPNAAFLIACRVAALACVVAADTVDAAGGR
ncbi:hypothetical protein ACWEBX_23875 [Streptomyces sp. NPDC005070]